ncbi:MAG: DUF4238 domain-containing protein [Calothrix sp. MO_167.B12]|nr:DUF4238 domain-containing protein [Calothrix sp. MO_167.B12]
MNKQVTKNQHYVPQCLLKHFSWDDRNLKRINIFDTVRSTTRYNQAIKEVFSRNYFYDRDNSVEDLLGNEIESPASPIIDEIIEGNIDDLLNFSGNKSSDKKFIENKFKLVKFIICLLYRTPEAREKSLSSIQTHIQSIVRELLRQNNFDPEEASKGYLNVEDKSSLGSLITLQSAIDYLLLIDLDFHIIKNETDIEFFISDHPVFRYNWFYRDLQHISITSLAAKGLQLFLPLSPSLTLCLYDSGVYKYGDRKSWITYVRNSSDIELLNSFQIINSESIIGFYSQKCEAHIRQLYNRFKDIQIYKHKSIEHELDEPEEDKIKTRHIVYTQQTKLKKMPSFVKIKREAKGQAAAYHERNPRLSYLHAQLMDEIDK